MKKTLLFCALLLLALGSCYYDVEEELYPTSNCQTANMSYANNILPIIRDNCYVCHSAALNTGNVTLEGYENLKGYADSGKLVGAVKHESGFSPMPQGQPKLIDCNVAKIEQWVNDGAPNN